MFQSSKYAPSVLLPFRSVQNLCGSFWQGLFHSTSKCSVAIKMQHLRTIFVTALACSPVVALSKKSSETRTSTTFYPAKLQIGNLNSEQDLREDGLIAVEVPGFEALNRAALRAAHECIDSTSSPQATLADGTVRRSLAASRSNNEAGPLEATCAPLAAAEAEFRRTVWSVAEAVRTSSGRCPRTPT